MPRLAKYEDWKAPWELKDEDFDEEGARKFIYDLLSDKQKLQDRETSVKQERDEARSKVTELEKALTDAQASKGDDESKKAIEGLQTKLAEATEKATKAEQQVLRLGVALDKGLTETQAKRLIGATREELEADADELMESFGGRGKANEDDEDDDEDEVLRRQPKLLNNPGDRTNGAEAEIDIEKAIASIPRL